MSNHPSAAKRARRSLRRNDIHGRLKGQLKACEKNFRLLAAKKDPKAQDELKSLIRGLDKAVQKGLFHKNKVARKKSRAHQLLFSKKNH